MLGFACHTVLTERAAGTTGSAIRGRHGGVRPLFLRKIALLEQASAGEAVLLPNRFETDPGGRFPKLYVDGPIPAHVTRRWQDVGRQHSINLGYLGENVQIERPTNPHAGCWFLSRRQFARWQAQPWFADRRPLFFGPLESAATLGIMRTFRLYKPALDNAAFLEAEHPTTGHGRRRRRQRGPASAQQQDPSPSSATATGSSAAGRGRAGYAVLDLEQRAVGCWIRKRRRW
jgi:hypothetical protein